MYYILIVAISGIICAALALRAWHQREVRGARSFIVLMLAVGIWSLTYAFELGSTTLPAKILWAKLEYLGIVCVPVAWLAFALEYTERDRWLARPILGLLSLVPLGTLGLVWTNEEHRLIWTSITLVPGSYVVGWNATYGAGFWFFAGYSYLLLLIGTALLLRVSVHSARIYRGQAVAVVLGGLFPWIGNLLYTFHFNPLPGIELTPLAFTITGIVLSWALSTWRLLDMVPVARDRMFESMVDSVFVIDKQERILDINPAACILVGTSHQVAVGQTLMALLPSSADLIARYKAAREANTEISIGEGSKREVFHLSISPLRKQGREAVGRLVVLRNITALKETEQALVEAKDAAEAANRAKSAFLAMMSHEIRTPLNSVIGMADLLRGTELTGQQREFTEAIRSSASTLLTLINDILDFSKIEADRLDLEHQPFDLASCIETALDLVVTPAAEKGLDLGYVIAPSVAPMIYGDETRLRQVLANLLSNAVKFTNQGEVVVEVRMKDEGGRMKPGMTHNDADLFPHPSSLILFAVRDTGVGISAESIERLFQSFSQAEAGISRKYGGTGLGLAISKRLVELMGGTIWVESTPDRGSTFFFTIQAEPAALAHGAEPHREPLISGRRVLVVEDNGASRITMIRQLRAWGLEPTGVASGVAALELIKRAPRFDLILIDHQMPDMDGVMLSEHIRNSRATHEIPLVLLTSLISARGTLPNNRFSALLTKPVKASQLYNSLVEIFVNNQRVANGQPAARRTGSGRFNIDTTMGVRHPLRILLAEDNKVNEQLVLRMIEHMGYSADVTRNGAEALAALQQQAYDVVLMDVQMPVMDGLEAARRIRAEIPAERQPRIIAITANAMPDDRARCLAVGMDDYISKPIAIQALVAALARSMPTPVALPESATTPPAAPAQPTEPEEGAGPINQATLSRLRMTLGRQADIVLPNLIATFITEADRLSTEARSAISTGDAVTVRRVVHTLKSNSATFGAQKLEQLCLTLERQAAQGSLDNAEGLFAQIQTEFLVVREALSGVDK